MTTEIGRKTRRLAVAAIGALLTIGTAPALAATHYAAPAPDGGTPGNWPCTSAASPCDLTTAIQGNGASLPASGDEVVVENTGTAYTLGNDAIKAPVSENIHGAAGAPAPQINDAFTSGNTGETLAAVEVDGGELTRVDISVTQSGTNQTTAAAWSFGGTVFDDDVFSSPGSIHAAGVLMTAGDKLLDSVANASGVGSTAVFANAYAGSTLFVRNVTAYATGSSAVAVYAVENPNGSPTPCPPQPMTVSMRNVIAQSTSAALSGTQNCPSDVANFDVDYSDYHPATLPTGFTSTPGAHNIDQAPLFASVNPANLDFHELAGSPTIDTGTNDPQDGATDPDGHPRFLGAAPDMGAFEFPAAGAVTGDVTGITKTDARLNGTVDSEGTDTTVAWAFEYGTTPSLGQATPTPDATAAPNTHTFPFPQPVSMLLSGLQPGTTYYYRLRAKNGDGQTLGATRTFTTNSNVKIAFAGDGNGVVNSSPDIGGCDVTCTLSAQAGTPYTLTATAGSGSAFTGWSGGGCAGTAPCTATFNTNATVTATFTKIGKPTLTAVKLTGVRKHKPKLQFTVTQGTSAPGLKRLEVTLSNGFTFGALHHAIHVNDHLARARVSRGVLIIKLPLPTARLKVTLIGPAITITNGLHHRLRLTVTVKDAGGTVTRLIHEQK